IRQRHRCSSNRQRTVGRVISRRSHRPLPCRQIKVGEFKRQPPSLLARYVFGALLYTAGAAFTRILDKLGHTERFLTFATKQRVRRTKADNPFRNYVPGEHDVFIATFAKSRTNWMMQIAHQLAFHGEAEYDHIHSVVPWPDTLVMPNLGK